MRATFGLSLLVLSLVAGCAGANGSAPLSAQTLGTRATAGVARTCSAPVQRRSGDGMHPSSPAQVVPHGFHVQVVAQVPQARELAALPNGDLLVGTLGNRLYLVPDAEADGAAGTPVIFATFADHIANGVTFVAANCTIYAATEHAVWSIPYRVGERSAPSVTRIARVRTGPIAPGSDGDVHTTTSVGFARRTLYIGVGSSCNACVEVDPTRAAVLAANASGRGLHKVAKRIRNPIALATDPATGALWVGGAGQDDLPAGHPYEFLDDLSAHWGVADYGWPECEENHHAYVHGADCTKTVEPRVELLAYSTIIAAAFYPLHQGGTYAFPAAYRGDLFASAHGSWHDATTTPGLRCASPAQVVAIPMHGDRPARPVDWKDPTRQWTGFFTGFQTGCGAGARNGRPTGIAVGARGSLFVADDDNGVIYRIRPVH